MSETPHEAAARIVRAFVAETQLASWGMDLLDAGSHLRKGHFSVMMWLVPGPYEILAHFDEPGDDPHALAIRVLSLFDEFPSHWPDVEFRPRHDAPTRGPDVAGPGWWKG